ncbi:MAG: YtxH domain-containing protein [Patescibacteria group bacterium]
MSAKNFVRGAALGALFASVASLLLAPKAGKKTREDVAKFSKELAHRLHDERLRASTLTQQQYENILGTTIGEYSRGKKLAKGFVNDITTVLKDYFLEVKKELSSLGADLSPKGKPASKPVSKAPSKKKKNS